MKKTLIVTVLVLLSLAPLALAQRQRGRELSQVPALSLTTVEPQYPLGQAVQFVLAVSQGALNLQGNYYIIERLVGQTWQPFYTSPENALEADFLGPNSKHSWDWDQTNNDGDAADQKGPYRIKLFLPNTLGGQYLAADFTLLPAPPGARLQLRTMAKRFSLGQPIQFRLANLGGAVANLDGCSYVIERREGNRWVEYLATRVNPFHFNRLAPGEVQKWAWQGHNRQEQIVTKPGRWRIVLTAPNVPNSPISAVFDII